MATPPFFVLSKYKSHLKNCKRIWWSKVRLIFRKIRYVTYIYSCALQWDKSQRIHHNAKSCEQKKRRDKPPALTKVITQTCLVISTSLKRAFTSINRAACRRGNATYFVFYCSLIYTNSFFPHCITSYLCGS